MSLDSVIATEVPRSNLAVDYCLDGNLGRKSANQGLLVPETEKARPLH